jgi:hypothetical protein
MTREELIRLGEQIVNCKGSEQEINKLIELFDENVPHPSGANLFYYPEKYNARKFDISTYNPTIEEVVDLCLSHKPILL